MMHFDANDYPFNSRRSVVYARNGMACAGNPTAASIGLQTLLKGGNAIDAAMAMSFAMPLVEPTGNGLGADAFALIWYHGKLYGINGSGPSPKALTPALLASRGYTAMPDLGPLSCDVPGAVGAWVEIEKRFGRLGLAAITAPAIDYAEKGFPVSPTMARLWQDTFRSYSKQPEKDIYGPWFDHFCPQGRPMQPGDMFASPDIAATIRSIRDTEGESFYRGDIARRIAEHFARIGGVMTCEDLAAYHPEWVEPISVNYRGYDVWEIPPNGHGITVLMALNMLKHLPLQGHGQAETLHLQIEAMKLAMTDTARHVTDPRCMRVTVEQLLSDAYAQQRASLIGSQAITPTAGDPTGSSTVYFCTADAEGNMVSMIQSNYKGFGSGVVIPGTGIAMNDRAFNFVLEEGHVNILEGGKKPYHTIIPGFLTKDGEAVGPFGVMGGFMQPQGHVQVVQNMIDWHMNPQQALDAPRWQWVGGKKVQVEQDMDNAVIRRLQRMGHEISVIADPIKMGRGQIILRSADGVLCAGTEKRTDGQIMAY